MTIKKKIGDRFVFLNTISKGTRDKLSIMNVKVLEDDKIIFDEDVWAGTKIIRLKDGSKLNIK